MVSVALPKGINRRVFLSPTAERLPFLGSTLRDLASYTLILLDSDESSMNAKRILALFTGVRGIGILGSSYTRSCITTPERPQIRVDVGRSPTPQEGEIATPMDSYAGLWLGL
jgi:hypothetical protein